MSEFRGADFDWKWRRRTAWNLFEEIATNMPEDEPGELAPATYADVVAYLLSVNGYEAGSFELPPDEVTLSQIAVGQGAARTRE